MADQGGNNSSIMREYRKGNWTLSETMVLIEAKKMDDERRLMKRSSGGGESGSERSSSRPTELRWKWVEDYCWRKGCLRSQNQCNDKWDNLMRDFKKVRDYEAREGGGGHGNGASYWKIEKIERKEKNLPSNMLREIYEALVEADQRKGGSKMVVVGGSTSGFSTSSSDPNIGYVLERHNIGGGVHLQQPPLHLPLPPLPPPPPPPLTQAPPPPPEQPPAPPLILPYSQSLPTDSDTSEHSDSPAKRRRKKRSSAGGGEGTSAATATASASNTEVGNAISKSASIIAEALQACEEKEERRHRDLLNLHERRLKIEESKTEINRQGIHGLVDAINKLANSILALASSSHKNQSPPPPPK